ncbi:acid phosphatase type 7-like [Gigantopelta aegis]|uniref:acid phosphatase type 7-like n=1 Tax=Gigantopelta aegis TaxID=1735272 RepID=UPI001B88D62C|nr:acid phosphatase type 7-like [Gigantopelta aegis]
MPANSLRRPEQVHISYGDTSSEMVVMWSTHKNVTSRVEFGETADVLHMFKESQVIRLTNDAWNAAPFIHRAELKGLQPGQWYSYRVVCIDEDNVSTSQEFSFHTTEYNITRPLSFIIFGDMGDAEGQMTINRVTQEVASKKYEAVWHIGDFAYNLYTDGGKVGDSFMNKIESIAANIPYMTIPGNHEIGGDFSHYRTRFSQPNTPWPTQLDSMWYSYDVGLVHFIAYSTEVYFTYNQNYVCEQFYWLLNDLEQANRNRHLRPWVVAMGHRPMYCSNNNRDDCSQHSWIPNGWVKRGLEDLFHAQGVDVIIEAHEHSYERLWPVFDGRVMSEDYRNPPAPIHIISGAAGSREGNDPMESADESWSAFRHSIFHDTTYGHLVVHNHTHLFWDQVRSKDGHVFDQIWIVQKIHGPFVRNLNCSGDGYHSSCYCPPPFHFWTIFIAIAAVFSFFLLTSILCCVRRCCRRRSAYAHTLLLTDDDDSPKSPGRCVGCWDVGNRKLEHML